MPDLRPPGRTMKRKRLDTNFDIAIDTNSQADRFKRQNSDDDNHSINLTPSNKISDTLCSAVRESTPTTPTGEFQPPQLSPSLVAVRSFQVPRQPRLQPCQSMTSRQFRAQSHRSPTLPPGLQTSPSSTLAPEPQSSRKSVSPSTQRPISLPELKTLSADNQVKKPRDDGKVVQKWEPKEWDENEFDSDEENMSLAVTMKLANELSLLKSFLEIYRKFNVHLGDIVSGPRHKGFLFLISSTVTRLEAHTTHLRTLRHEKQRGNPTPSTVELIADKIARKCKTRRKHLWEVMEEKVDMTNEAARATWVKKKKAVLGDVMGGLVGYLEELGEEQGWKEREVRVMGERWEKRWKAFGAMDRADLVKAGWILDVGK